MSILRDKSIKALSAFVLGALVIIATPPVAAEAKAPGHDGHAILDEAGKGRLGVGINLLHGCGLRKEWLSLARP